MEGIASFNQEDTRMRKLPIDVKALIETLNAEIPHRCPQPTDSEREIWMYAGKRALVDMLLTVAEQSRMKINRGAGLPDDEQDQDGGDDVRLG